MMMAAEKVRYYMTSTYKSKKIYLPITNKIHLAIPPVVLYIFVSRGAHVLMYMKMTRTKLIDALS